MTMQPFLQIHPVVLLTISDYCSGTEEKVHGPLFGTAGFALACAKLTDGSMPVSETISLLRRTEPHLEHIGWFYAGDGLEPERIQRPVPDSVLVLVDISRANATSIKAFLGGPAWREIEVKLARDPVSTIVLNDAVDSNDQQIMRRAKAALRERIAALRDQLSSGNEAQVADALYKHAMLKKVHQLQDHAVLQDDDLTYRYLAEVITRADQHFTRKSRETPAFAGTSNRDPQFSFSAFSS